MDRISVHDGLLCRYDDGDAGGFAAGEHQRDRWTAEVGAAAGNVLGATWLSPAIAILVLATALGQFGGLGSSVSRMPFAAGVDHLLPAAFAKIHPRWATPYVSILVFGGLASVLMIVSQFGDTLHGAYQTLVSLMVIGDFYRTSICSGVPGRWGIA